MENKTLFIKMIEAVTEEEFLSSLKTTTFFYHPDEASTTSYEFVWDDEDKLPNFTKEEKNLFAEYITELKYKMLTVFCSRYYSCEEEDLSDMFNKDEALFEKNVTKYINEVKSILLLRS